MCTVGDDNDFVEGADVFLHFNINHGVVAYSDLDIMIANISELESGTF